MEKHIEIIQAINVVGENITKRLDTLNGSVAKHEARLSTQDVLNAQMTITQQQIVNDLSGLKTEATKSSEFRTEAKATISVFKWLIGAIGVGTLITIISSIIK